MRNLNPTLCSYTHKPRFMSMDRPAGCQFDVPLEHLTARDGKLWCPFHLPITADETLAESVQLWHNNEWQNFHGTLREAIERNVNDQGFVDLTGLRVRGSLYFPTLIEHVGNLPFVALDDCQIVEGADFAGQKFEGGLSIQGAQVGGIAQFSKCEFPAVSFFMGTEFNQVQFDHAHFYSTAEFQGARFNGYANFHDAVLTGGCNFESAKFKMSAEFKDATLRKKSNFRNAGFVGDVDFSGAGMPTNSVDFANAAFAGLVSFNERTFGTVASFSHARFGKAPEFHNCTFHQNTDFNGTEFNDCGGHQAARAYRTLKLAMEEHRHWDEAFRFHALEMKSRRHDPTTPKSIKLFSLFYELGSDYGQSISQPLLWLLFVTWTMFCIYMNFGTEWITSPTNGLSFTLEQYVRPFSIWITKYQEEFGDTVPVAWRLVASLQSLAGIGLITLFILALRRRFRMG